VAVADGSSERSDLSLLKLTVFRCRRLLLRAVERLVCCSWGLLWRYVRQYDVKGCDAGVLVQIIEFLDIIHCPVFISNSVFGNWTQ
jgi:hypothetical protein